MIVLLSISFAVYFNSITQNRQALDSQTDLLTEEAALYFSQEINNRINLIELFTHDWLQVENESQLYSEERFYQKVENYGTYFSGIRAISWINTSGHIAWRYSNNENVSVIGQSIVMNKDGTENIAFSIANASHVISITNPKTLYIYEQGYVVYYPLIYNGTLTGFMNLVFVINDFITEMLENKPVLENYDLLLVDDSDPIFNKGQMIDISSPYTKNDFSDFLNRTWQVYLTPNRAMQQNASFFGNWPILAIGIGAAVIITVVFYLLMKQTSRVVIALNEKELMQEALIQAKKMEAVGRLAGGVAHDFNNLLTAINGFSELALFSVEEGDEVYESLNEIHKAGLSAAELTQQLLTFNRKHIIESKIFDFGELVTEIQPLFDRLIGENIQIVFNPPIYPIWIEGDPNQVQQIIVNMVVNSKDAMPNGGLINLNLAREVYEHTTKDQFNQKIKPGHYCLFEISDTGEGMDESVIEHIFEPFYTTKEIGHGTGLGLSIVYNIVQQMGGYIWFKSKKYQGTTFQILFPISEAPTEDALREVLARPSFPKNAYTILVAEDDSGVRKFIRKVLKKQGYTVHTAKNGEDALQKLKKEANAIDLVVSDVVMPQMGGMRLIESLDSYNITVKVLFISGYAEHSLNSEEMRKIAQEFSFLQKPFSAQTLVAKINEILLHETEKDIN